jgi:hypothetical protein
MQLVAQLGNVALERGARNLQFGHDFFGRHSTPTRKQAFVLVQANDLAHSNAFG